MVELTADNYKTHRIVVPGVSAYGIGEVRIRGMTKYVIMIEWISTGNLTFQGTVYDTLDEALAATTKHLSYWNNHKQYRLKLEASYADSE